MNMFMYLLISMPFTPPKSGSARLTDDDAMGIYPRPSRPPPVASMTSTARLVNLALSDYL
jgi:hypothetical protein